MITQADRTQKNKNQAVANSVSKPQSNSKPAFQFANRAPECVVQPIFQDTINNNSRVRQLKAFREIANNSPQVKQLRAYQAIADHFTSKTAQRKKNPGEEPWQGKSGSARTIQLHPLESDNATYNISVLDALREIKEDGTLRDLILEESPEAIQVMQEFVKKRGKTGESDLILLKSILATIELHRSGVWYEAFINGNPNVFGEDEKKIMEIMQIAYNQREELAKAYGLSKEELHSIECYTQPGKNNKDGPWYMGPHKKWGSYKNGWEALKVALAKLPSLRDLGLEITTYRVIRTEDRARKESTGSGIDPTTAKLSKLAPETNILHGRNPIPPFGQKHYISTGITYTTSHMTDDRTQQGLVGVTGGSGKYIGPFGVAHWSHDAGEVLYPPEMYSKFEGTAPEGWQDDENTLPVHHLREVGHPEPQQGIVEDHNFETIRDRDRELDGTKMSLIAEIEELVGNDIRKISLARSQSDVHGEMMYLNVDELRRLKECLVPNKDREDKKLALIDEITKLYRKNPEALAEALSESEVHGNIGYLSLPELQRLKKKMSDIVHREILYL